MVSLNVNGQARQVDVPPSMPLLWVLRDVIGLTGTKFGCGMALCGACTVHVDGQPIRSCVTPVAAVAGKRITTSSGPEHGVAWRDRRAGHVGGGAGRVQRHLRGNRQARPQAARGSGAAALGVRTPWITA